jgi:hypothetical protein
MDPLSAFHLLTRLPPDELEDTAKAVIGEASLAWYIRFAWHLEHEDEPLKWGWHADCIAEHCEALWDGEIEWLIVSILPGIGKSLWCSVYFPSWGWIGRPRTKFLCCSTNDLIVFRDARRHRDLVEHRWYRRLFLPDWTLSKSQKATGSFANTRGGERVSRTVRSGSLGARPHVKILDDPNDPESSDSESCDKVNRWLENTFLKRKIIGLPDKLLVIQHRVAEMDASGFLLARKRKAKHVHLVLPNEYDPARTFVSFVPRRETGETWEDPRTEEGELLAPDLMGPEETELNKEDMEVYSALYQQDPTPPSGLIFQRDWFRRWSYEPNETPPDDVRPTYPLPAKFDYSFISCDPNNLRDENASRANTDYCPIQLYGVLGPNVYLREELRQKLSAGAATMAIYQYVQLHPNIICTLIERSAAGPTMITSLRNLLGVPHEDQAPEAFRKVRAWRVQGESKRQRAKGVVHIVQAGRVYIPNELEFGEYEYWLMEVCGFPRRRRDDRVDCLTQALRYVESKPFG